MSNQLEDGIQQTLSPEEVRQHLLAESDASKQAIASLSGEQVEAVSGSGIGSFVRAVIARPVYKFMPRLG